MQVRFLLNEKTIHRQLYNNLLVSATGCNKKKKAAAFKIFEESGVPNNEEIINTIIFLEHIVKTLEKEVHYLREYNNTLKTVDPETCI